MSNREYYKDTFDEVHIPKELFGKVVQMEHQKKKKNTNYRIAVAAALVLVCAAAGTSSYAAIKHYRLSDFFAQTDTTIPKEGEKLIETNPEQKQPESPETSGTEQKLSDYVSSKVTESLCDSRSIHCNVAITPNDAEQYLLIPYGEGEKYIMENLGIKGEDKDLSCEKYAEKYQKKILYIDAGINQEVPVNMYTSVPSKLDSDGTLHFNFTMDNKTQKPAIQCTCNITLYEEEEGNIKEKSSGQLDFTVHDNSNTETVEYIPKANSNLKNTECILDRVSIQKTELGAYVCFDYHVSKKTKVNTKEILDGITYELVDSNDNILPGGLSDSGQSADLGNGKYQCTRNYEPDKMPEKIRVKVFDCWSKKVYGYIDVQQK